jgi:hypothetical protein
MARTAELPLEMGDVLPQQDPVLLVIGICHRCSRRGLLLKADRTCTGYRAVTAAGGVVQVPELRSKRCHALALRAVSRSNRKLFARLEQEPIRLGKDTS